MARIPATDALALTPRRLAGGVLAAGLVLGVASLLLVRKDQGGLGMFMPHGACYMWRADLIAGHVVSDAVIGLSYVSISLTLWYLVRQAKGAIPYHWIFVAFGTFIVACGMTHFMEILTLYRPLYWTSMGVKIVTAIASVATAIVLPPLVPRVLRLIENAHVSEERRLALQRASEELEVRMKQEQMLRREAQAANFKKDEFLANMSHELRTPLNSIIGFSELMGSGLVGEMAPPHREYLQDITTSSRHLLRLINDVLDLAKVESGTMVIQPEPVDVRAVIDEVCGTLKGLLSAKRLEVRTELDPALATVTVDAGRFRQILFNYLSNAIKFTPEGGRIALRIGPQGPDRFRVDVEDTGIGIAASDQSRLFVEFQQLDTGASKDFQGTGLGLALTRRLAEAQGGEVEVKSAPGLGSTFSVVLPRTVPGGSVAPPGPATRRASTAAGAVGAQPVLLVHDDPMTIKYATVVLANAGFRALSARTPDDALRVLAEENVRAVVVDHFLPEHHGVEFVEQVRAEPHRFTLPILSWTTHEPTPQEAQRLRTLGVVHVGRRTGDATGLIEELRRAVPPSGA